MPKSLVDLPAKIQAFVALQTARYLADARFCVPSKRALDTISVMEAIKRRTFHLPLLAAIRSILYPLPSSPHWPQEGRRKRLQRQRLQQSQRPSRRRRHHPAQRQCHEVALLVP